MNRSAIIINSMHEFASCHLSAHTEVQLSSRPATCSHSASAGQELCYLCHQRALRNVPVDATKDKKDNEKHENKMLLEYQRRKDLLVLAKEQAARMKTIGFNQEMASFNLEAAQRTKVRRRNGIIKVWRCTDAEMRVRVANVVNIGLCESCLICTVNS